MYAILQKNSARNRKGNWQSPLEKAVVLHPTSRQDTARQSLYGVFASLCFAALNKIQLNCVSLLNSSIQDDKNQG